MSVVHAQIQAQAAAQASGDQAGGAQVPLTDVVALADSDERGVGLAAAAFPMVMGGMIGGILISTIVVGASRRLGAITLYATLSGLVVTLILQPWFGFLQGSFALNWLAIGASMLATGAFIVGANAVFGKAGIALGAVVSMLVGNPISSAAQPVEFLPGAWGAIGQFFVPGASASLLRELSYFPDASHLHEWGVLAGWIVAGVLMMTLGHFRGQEVVHIEGATESDEDATPAIA